MNLKFDLDNSKKIDQSTNIDQSTHNDYSKHKTRINFNFKFLIIAIVVLAIVGGSLGIYNVVGGGSPESKVVGIWGIVDEDGDFLELYSFHSDRTCVIASEVSGTPSDLSGTWSIIENNQIRITINFIMEMTYVCDYEVNGGELTITFDGDTYYLVKK